MNNGNDLKRVMDAYGRTVQYLDRSDDSVVVQLTYNGLGQEI